MAQANRGSWVITLAGELCLFSGMILWVELIRGGISSWGLFLPAAFTLVGVFWLGRGLEKAGSGDRNARDAGDRVTCGSSTGRTV